MKHRLLGGLGLASWPAPPSGRGRTPVLALHGFAGAGAEWDAVASRLGRAVFAPDLLGHGRSPAPVDPGAYDLDRTIGRLLALLDRLALPRVALLGYSLGGRIAIHLALRAPERVAALALIGATPGVADPAERAARATEDEALAAEVERQGAAGFLAAWEARPLLATQARAPAPVRRARRRWRAGASAQGLARTLAALSPGVLPPRWDDLHGLSAPLLLLTGSEDAKFSAIARAVAARIPTAEQVEIPGAGHAPHLEQPVATACQIERFLARESRGRPTRLESLHDRRPDGLQADGSGGDLG